ncbi:transposase [Xanthomonas oryzae]|uniref:transposase n=1 Tax=Xanthomonas oryzae TaxID=347 RepID=UPI0031B60291
MWRFVFDSNYLRIRPVSRKNSNYSISYICGEFLSSISKHVTVQIAKRSELHTFKVMPKRWSVERSFAWLEKNRRLWKNCERRLNTSLQFIHLAFLALLLMRS